jgi:hypothetical protein
LSFKRRKLPKRDHECAWAAITAVEWFKNNREHAGPSDPWWTLDFKRRAVGGELMKPAKKGA